MLSMKAKYQVRVSHMVTFGFIRLSTLFAVLALVTNQLVASQRMQWQSPHQPELAKMNAGHCEVGDSVKCHHVSNQLAPFGLLEDYILDILNDRTKRSKTTGSKLIKQNLRFGKKSSPDIMVPNIQQASDEFDNYAPDQDDLYPDLAFDGDAGQRTKKARSTGVRIPAFRFG